MNTNETKRKYEKPSMKVYQLHCRAKLLVGSPGGGNGGGMPGGVPGVPF